MNKHSDQAGITLLGVLVAIFVLVVVITSTTQLMVRGQQAARISQENLIAASVAREGLELVQSVRDTNWFRRQQGEAGLSWVDQLCDDDRQPGRRLAIDVNADHSINVFVDPRSADTQLYRSRDGIWSHISSTGQPTRYSRVISIDCQHAVLSEGDSGDDPEVDPEHVTVHAQVSWVSRGRDRRVEVSTKLFNWHTAGSS